MSINSVSVNDQMPKFAFDRLIQEFGDLGNKRITFLGVSYRGDVGDTRFSPVELLFVLVKNTGAKILLHDPFVTFWEEQNCSIESDLSKVLNSDPDLVIISTGHNVYREEHTIKKLLEIDTCKIYDTIGLLEQGQISKLQTKHYISVLGRGDLK